MFPDAGLPPVLAFPMRPKANREDVLSDEPWG
jgi:hypothetical protein